MEKKNNKSAKSDDVKISRMAKRMYLLRGRLIEKAIAIELIADEIISLYFIPNNERKLIAFEYAILHKESFNLSFKLNTVLYLIKNNETSIYEKYSLKGEMGIGTAVTEFLKVRNHAAHRMMMPNILFKENEEEFSFYYPTTKDNKPKEVDVIPISKKYINDYIDCFKLIFHAFEDYRVVLEKEKE
jgi:hypothetical protein